MEKIVFLIILLTVGGALGYYLLFQDFDFGDSTNPTKQTQEKTVSTESPRLPEIQNIGKNEVFYTDSGYVPISVTIKAGETVKFINKSSKAFWPASALHPTHRVYPESGVEKCFTTEAETIFDACDELSPGSEWSFGFNETGTWRYHDHLSPRSVGTIVVE